MNCVNIGQDVWAAVTYDLVSGEHESSRGQLFVFVTVFTDVVPTLLIRLQLGVFGKVVSRLVSTFFKLVSRTPRATTIYARIVYESLRPEQGGEALLKSFGEGIVQACLLSYHGRCQGLSSLSTFRC